MPDAQALPGLPPPDPALGTDKMLSHAEGGIGWMIFNNPARHNAVSLEMWVAAERILAGFAADPAVRVLIVTGAGGKAFVSGADISKFESERGSKEAVEAYQAQTARVYEALAAFPKPTLAAIRGHCIGGGAALAVCCDLRFCTEASTFGIPAAKLGLGYPLAGIRRLVQLVGPSFTQEMFFTARRFSAAEAQGMGLVNRVVADAALEGAVLDYATTIAGNAPLTVAAVKAIVAEALKAAPDEALCERLVLGCFASEDYAEGRRAFLEKRPPCFQGR
ncbi:enoyl-CoA hydratase [Roseomonas sp. GC11]|uniref:enoyl-CoA hydratase n=1 Tax=Roseomonas sp. GC11 TaxID=2950546 RepID=UPI0021097EFE|nr:enoyl-CoA hydratase [Roseomonas sp. GC11]MCQ4159468.1 enoyl-CoA hydratase [Roseomonas sp. GC11]